ncbi:unnamed protein product [Boreogadus saida]
MARKRYVGADCSKMAAGCCGVKEQKLSGSPGHPQPTHPQVLNTDIIQVLQTLAESLKSLGARMDAVETPIRTPGRLQGPSPQPASSVVTVPFHFLPERPGAQPSVSAFSANTAYTPAACLAILPTAAICGSFPSSRILYSIYSSISSASG